MTTSAFQPREAFAAGGDYRLLPFRFGQLDGDRYVLSNDVGEHVVLPRRDLAALVNHKLTSSSESYRALKTKHFLFDEHSTCAVDLLALKYRTRAARVAEFTGLHIFVVTLRCDHSCQYCQVSRQSEESSAFDMSVAHAERALDIVFQTPSRNVKIEFQGGEPLLNFGLIRHIVLRAREINETHAKALQFVIATNLSRLDEEILAFAKEHDIFFSTSLDGPADLHDRHRPLPGDSSHAVTLRGIDRVRAELGPDHVSALMTTTPASMGRVHELIDEYVRCGFSSIFLRPLSPYGFAAKSLVRKYDVDAWLDFYKAGLAHILDLNRGGTRFREDYTCILLQKMFQPSGAGYVDLQSPAGLGIAAIVMNYDGAVYASDEGRMLAEMGDQTFRLGHLNTDTYEDLLTNDALIGWLEDSLPESAPMCTDCPFQSFCGADPVFHHATLGDPVGHKALSGFCRRQMGILRHLVTLFEDDPSARRILRSWV